jgi:tRNA dimethylallyltransferase
MQLYKGLPIVTNKMPVAERRGIPHHLLDHTGLDDTPWSLDDFKRSAATTIADIRARGNLPIVVGGTHYYTNALLFKDITVGTDKEADSELNFPILSEPNDVILAKLKEVDPVMAARWHPNDHRKIRRSLEIYLQYGRPASEIYEEQKLRKAQGGGSGQVVDGLEDDEAPWESLLFWVHSDTEVLRARLDGRIDKMLDAGLMDEISGMHEHVRQREARGEPVAFDKGIWQSIGFKEFRPYLKAVDEGAPAAEIEALRRAGVEQMKTATRQYANSQTRWIRTKTVPLLQQRRGAMGHLFVVDSTDVSQWTVNVAEPAVDVARRFLEGTGPLPDPGELSATARRVLDAATAPPAERTVCQKTCELCGTTTTTLETWEKHMRSKKHKALVRGRGRRALVPVDEVPPPASDVAKSRPSSPDMQLGGFFEPVPDP